MTKESKLSKIKLEYEDSQKKFKLSRTAGKPKHLFVRAFNSTLKIIVGFFVDIYRAIKAIAKEIM